MKFLNREDSSNHGFFLPFVAFVSLVAIFLGGIFYFFSTKYLNQGKIVLHLSLHQPEQFIENIPVQNAVLYVQAEPGLDYDGVGGEVEEIKTNLPKRINNRYVYVDHLDKERILKRIKEKEGYCITTAPTIVSANINLSLIKDYYVIKINQIYDVLSASACVKPIGQKITFLSASGNKYLITLPEGWEGEPTIAGIMKNTLSNQEACEANNLSQVYKANCYASWIHQKSSYLVLSITDNYKTLPGGEGGYIGTLEEQVLIKGKSFTFSWRNPDHLLSLTSLKQTQPEIYWVKGCFVSDVCFAYVSGVRGNDVFLNPSVVDTVENLINQIKIEKIN